MFRTDWSEENIKFYVDDVLLYTFVPKKYDDKHYPFRKPFYFLINLAVGGNLGGAVIDDAALPQKLYVDYIKVTKL
ncbi:family 16 glycosylhydrolase [Gillisia marina]|uniref:family 16 glycosylhydrolase n=1 Tax=Gillisia marina TaxID=1167637 RepID=UPI001ED8DB39|nr:family 16 glycosylhydrolase [Gillisia marina]